jgi:phytoene/squalene synthetase
MNAETITINELRETADRMMHYANELARIHYRAAQGELTPEMATEQANTILARIEVIASITQTP